jgi:hypothetical protein
VIAITFVTIPGVVVDDHFGKGIARGIPLQRVHGQLKFPVVDLVFRGQRCPLRALTASPLSSGSHAPGSARESASRSSVEPPNATATAAAVTNAMTLMMPMVTLRLMPHLLAIDARDDRGGAAHAPLKSS